MCASAVRRTAGGRTRRGRAHVLPAMVSSLGRAAVAAGLVALAGSVAACGGQDPSQPSASPSDGARASDRQAGRVRFHDAEIGITGQHPAGWYRARAISNLALPREVLVLATYPLRPGAKAGECAPNNARADMPVDGTFIWLLEYRPLRGEVWADLPRDRFPPKPDRFELRRRDLGGNNSCFPGPTYRTTFRAADRPLQLLVAFGGPPADDRLNEVAEILTSLRFDELPPPPADPYAGWPLVNDDSGDSLRPPPGWAAAAARYVPGETVRPRALFFASNRPLAGLPAELVPQAELSDSMPDAALANNFPNDAVLLWVVEERRDEPTGRAIRSIDRTWPHAGDFEPAEAPAPAAPGVRWLHAGGSFQGYRFSVWIAEGSGASDRDRQLAKKSAASLAVSGCWRDAIDDCPDQ